MSPGKSFINRVLRSLAEIHESQNSSPEERLQALRLSIEAIDRRPVAKRKTDKDKALIAALGGKSGKKKSPTAAGDKIPQSGKR